MWYPPITRTKELDAELTKLAEAPDDQLGEIDDFLIKTSVNIRQLALNHLIPTSHLRDWIWIGSQFRLSAGDRSPAWPVCKGALIFLNKYIHQAGTAMEQFQTDFNWVADKTVSELVGLHGPRSYDQFLSPAELDAVEVRLAELRHETDDLSTHENDGIAEYTAWLSNISSETYLPGIAQMVDEIRIHVDAPNPVHRSSAIACLRYVLEKQDVVPDGLGYLGLVDDIYAIEVTFRNLNHQNAFRPLVEWLSVEQPSLARISFQHSRNAIRFDQYLQAVFGLSLIRDTGQSNRNCLVLPETSICGLIGAFLAAVQSIRTQITTRDESVSFSPGDDMILSDASVVIAARYSGTLEHAGVSYHTVEIRDGRRTITDLELASAAKSPTAHRNLSTEKDFGAWRKTHGPSPLRYLVGADFSFEAIRPEVLLLTRRNRLDELVPELLPMGSTIPELVGLKYVTSTGTESVFPGTPIADPLIVACSDPATARDLILDPDDGMAPRYIVVDDGELARDLEDLIAGAELPAECHVIVFSPFHESEATRALIASDYSTWLLRKADVNPLPPDAAPGSISERGLLSRFQARQALASRTTIDMHDVQCEPIEFMFEYLRDLRREAKSDADTDVELLAIALSAFIRRFTATPLEFDDIEREELSLALRRVVSHSGVLADYNPAIRDLSYYARQTLDSGIPPNPRHGVTRHLLENVDADRVAVLCQSAPMAAAAAAKAARDPVLSRASWVSINQLRSMSPIDHLVVPGWIGRHAMREIRNCGYAVHMALLLFGFEREWEAVSRKAGASWEKRLVARSRSQWSRLAARVDGLARPAFIDVPTPPENEPYPSEEDSSGEEFLNTRLVEAIRSRTSPAQGDDLAQARLVVFEEPGAYIYLPPNGSVISLSRALEALGGRTEADLEAASDSHAERFINCSVADIRPGDLLAFPQERNWDLLDVFANRLMETPVETRRLAQLWRSALHRFSESNNYNVRELRSLLAAQGLKRHQVTISGWLHGGNIIAPLGYHESIPIIAAVTGDIELSPQIEKVLSSVDLVYRARYQAARELLKQLIRQDIRVSEGTASVQVEDHRIHYSIQRVLNIDPPVQISREHIGLLSNVTGSTDPVHSTAEASTSSYLSSA